MIQNVARRQFEPSRTAKKDKRSESPDGKERLLQTIKDSMQITRPQKERTPTPSNSSDYNNDDVLEDMEIRLQHQVEGKKQAANDSKEDQNDIMDIFNQPELSPQLSAGSHQRE